MLPGDDQRVALADRESVAEGNPNIILQPDPGGILLEFSPVIPGG